MYGPKLMCSLFAGSRINIDYKCHQFRPPLSYYACECSPPATVQKNSFAVVADRLIRVLARQQVELAHSCAVLYTAPFAVLAITHPSRA